MMATINNTFFVTRNRAGPHSGPKNSPNNCCAYSIKSSWSIPSQSFDGDFPEHSAQRRSQWMRRGDAYTVGRKLVVLHRSEVRFTFTLLQPDALPRTNAEFV